MPNINKQAFWEELDATNEDFVRQKHARGGYGVAKGQVVAQWLAERDRLKLEQQALEESKLTQITARWTKVSGIAASLATAAALLGMLLHQVH